MFTHEKFEAYQLAIEFTDIALQLMDDLPAGQSDRKRFYAIARGLRWSVLPSATLSR